MLGDPSGRSMQFLEESNIIKKRSQSIVRECQFGAKVVLILVKSQFISNNILIRLRHEYQRNIIFTDLKYITEKYNLMGQKLCTQHDGLAPPSRNQQKLTQASPLTLKQLAAYNTIQAVNHPSLKPTRNTYSSKSFIEPHLTLNHELHFLQHIQHFSFTQRRVLGFMQQYEFDKRRFLVQTQSMLSIFDYDHLDQMVEVYREERTDTDSRLICSTFLCDHFHNYVLVVTALGDSVEYKISKLTNYKQVEQFFFSKLGLGFLILDASYVNLYFNQTKNQEIDDIMATEQTQTTLATWSGQVERKFTNKGAIHERLLDQIRNGKLKLQKERNFNCYTAQPDKKVTSTSKAVQSQASFGDSGSQYYLLPQGVLTQRAQVKRVLVFHDGSGTWILNINQSETALSAMVIRPVMKESQEDELFNDCGPSMYKSMKIDCFKMSKRFEITLEWPIKTVDLHGDFVIISYKAFKGKKFNKVIDIYNKHTGLEVQRIDLQSQFQELQLSIISVDELIIPKLKWSDRLVDDLYKSKPQKSDEQAQLKPKLAIYGKCYHKIGDDLELKYYLALYDSQKNILQALQFIQLPLDVDVTCISFGPFDNNYLLLGLSNGVLVGFEVPSLNIMFQERLLHKGSIDYIQFEPTEQIFVSSKNESRVVSFSTIRKKTQYMYVETEKEQYCTIVIPTEAIKERLDTI